METPNVSAKKQALIDAKNATPITVGETVIIKQSDVDPNAWDKNYKAGYEVLEIDGDMMKIRRNDAGSRATIYEVSKSGTNIDRAIFRIGENPFGPEEPVRYVSFSIESILWKVGFGGRRSIGAELDVIFGMSVPEMNWNPYIFDSDFKKVYYQRPLVWTLEDKQLLIESLYQRLDCGRVMVRKHSWGRLERIIKSGETEVAFHDIVDGKQRISTLISFMQNEFPDLYGNYWGDLSFNAQTILLNLQSIAFAELPEDCDDATVIRQFLKLNFAGVPQSKEHIEFVKSIRI